MEKAHADPFLPRHHLPAGNRKLRFGAEAFTAERIDDQQRTPGRPVHQPLGRDVDRFVPFKPAGAFRPAGM